MLTSNIRHGEHRHPQSKSLNPSLTSADTSPTPTVSTCSQQGQAAVASLLPGWSHHGRLYNAIIQTSMVTLTSRQLKWTRSVVSDFTRDVWTADASAHGRRSAIFLEISWRQFTKIHGRGRMRIFFLKKHNFG